MARVFNLGIGLVVVVPLEQAQATIHGAEQCGNPAFLIGVVEKGERAVHYA
jgi:phosphoribosylformylglycinamidine cyclo-ligase